MSEAFAHPVTRGIVAATAGVLVLAAAVIGGLSAAGRVSPALRRELWLRLGSWAVLLPLMLGPVLLGRVWTIGAVTVLGLLCLREYDRATGLFREPLMTAGVALGMKPPVWLEAGDEIRMGIDALGEQRQRVVPFRM